MKRIAISLAAVVLAISGYYFLPQIFRLNQSVELSSEEATIRAERQPPSGWREYRNEHYGFSLFYPEALTIKEFDEGGGASTVIFQNPKEGMGFQIFIVPFSGKEITDERFKKDVPSGVRTDIENITIDGATGAAFYSKDLMLADTKEVWFIKGGFLYEITTLREQNTWLSLIMETWLFI